MTRRPDGVIHRATRATAYACGHTLIGDDRVYDPRVEYAAVVRWPTPCPWCRRLRAWRAGQDGVRP
jgi:hypothetical protein